MCLFVRWKCRTFSWGAATIQANIILQRTTKEICLNHGLGVLSERELTHTHTHAVLAGSDGVI